jgi:PTH1 family peptidyl-tRNA hydrolase
MNLKQTKLIVGLGNIGREYQDTRHNAGFWCVDYLAEKLGISLREDKKFLGSVGRGMLQGNEVLLLEPSTLMNLSGKSVASAAAFFKIKPSDILVIHDDLDLLPGQKKFKCGGGNAGHNGLKSICQCLGTPDFYRLRLGIGHPRTLNLPMAVADFVLARPSGEDFNKIRDNILSSYEGIELWAGDELEKAKRAFGKQ